MKNRTENEKSPYATLSAESIRIKKNEGLAKEQKKTVGGDLRVKGEDKTWKRNV